jgi:DNA-directed RNA polymerase specialized sigma24 family protein
VASRPLTDTELLTLAEAAELLSGGQGPAGERIRWAVEAQLVRRGVATADRDDVRADVACALLASERTQALTPAAVAAHAARVARNKAIDHHRRRRFEYPEQAIAERAAVPADGLLEADLDAVAGEVHRRDVSSALSELVRELPAPERRALTAAALGAGHLGSGLGRSSHYRALDRARLRLTAAVRSRVAAGLALPAVLLRGAAHLRAFLLPAGAAAAAAVASVAFVLPAIETPPPAAAARVVPARLATTVTVAKRPALAAPVRVVQRRIGTSRRVVVRAAVRRVVAPAHAVVSPPPVSAPAAPVAPPPAGVSPCRAALLCQ